MDAMTDELIDGETTASMKTHVAYEARRPIPVLGGQRPKLLTEADVRQLLREACEATGLEQLAKDIGVSCQHITNVLQGLRAPSAKLRAILGLKLVPKRLWG